MSTETCILTTKDFTILEVMRERCLGSDDPLAPILKRKIESALVVFRDDVPANVATLSSRVTFRVDGRDPDTRILSHDRMNSSAGLFLPISQAEGCGPYWTRRGSGFHTDRPRREGRVRIPIQSGQVFRFEVGHHSGMKPATIPINNRPLSGD
jgi:regulator of nucleoside diphosphate kinase